MNVVAAPARHRTWIAGFPLGALLAGMLSFGGPVTTAEASGTPAWTAYVANQATNNVTPVDTATGATGSAIAVGSEPGAIAITPDGKTAYVVNESSDNVTPINTLTNIAGAPIAAGSLPQGIAISPDGKMAYVTNALSKTRSLPSISPQIHSTLDSSRPGSPRHRNHTRWTHRLRGAPAPAPAA